MKLKYYQRQINVIIRRGLSSPAKLKKMARLDIERQNTLEPRRMEFAKKEIEKKGYVVWIISDTQLRFEHQGGHCVNFFPYSGWATGATIKDGRGLKKLLKQI